MTSLLLQSLLETILMVGASALISILVGIPLAVLLTITSPDGLYPHGLINHVLGGCINAMRSIPYIILVVLMMPITRLMVGSSIGTLAAIIPLSLAGALLVTRMVEDSLRNIKHELIEVGLAMGATKRQIITKILLYEAMPSMTAGITTVLINLIGFSAMAGAVGGGGLGDLAIRYGYQRYDFTLMMIIVVILIILVQGIQMMGDFISRRLAK
ncbi:MAG: ABC transporter permease [Alphaproteobacteria bacterium]|jgi:D-methionine transport system permease protein|nr:ABC transporter permease [Alphaproteobacteria bacterium]